MSQEYAKAQDCFRAALAVRPEVSPVLMHLTDDRSSLFVRIGCFIIEWVRQWPTTARPRKLSCITTARWSSIRRTSGRGKGFSAPLSASLQYIEADDLHADMVRFNLGISYINLQVSAVCHGRQRAETDGSAFPAIRGSRIAHPRCARAPG